jgi:cytochrome c biogenesis protein CcdA
MDAQILKRICAYALGAFALVTLGAFAGREVGLLSVPAEATAPGLPLGSLHPQAVAVFYLHGDHPCASCGQMSNLAEQVIRANFQSELAAGKVRFCVENYDRPGNAFFRRSCQVVSPTVLLVEYQHGQPGRWKNLTDIWEWTEDEPGLKRYLCAETRAFLAGTTLPASPPGNGSRAGVWLALASAFGMGLLAAISPCALATNAVAMAFLGQSGLQARRLLLRAAGYAVGRVAAYVLVGAVLISGLLSVSVGGWFLMKYLNALLGPVLILASLVLFQLVRLNWAPFAAVEAWQRRAENGGLGAALLLGMVLALAFCPMSAALFFGGLLPLALKTQASGWMPAAFGLGTSLPVVLFVLVAWMASRKLGPWFKRIRQVETGLRLAAACSFLGVGFYYSVLCLTQRL